MAMLSATDRSGSSDSSWNTQTIPAALAACGPDSTRGTPSIASVPLSGCTTPAMILISVLLPAPFSPSTAWIDPARVARSTPSSARTPP